MARKNRKASKNRLFFFGSISFLCIFYFLGTLFTNLITVQNLQNEQISLEKDLFSLKANEEILKTEIVKLKDPDYLARYAREHYMYSKDGEYIIKIEGNNEIKKEEIQKEVKIEKKQRSVILPILLLFSSLGSILLIKKVIL